MAAQRIRPDQGRDEPQRVERRRVNRTIKLGTLALAAIVGAMAVLIASVVVAPDERSATPAAVSVAGGGGTESEATQSPDPDPLALVGFVDATPSTPLRGDLVMSFGGIHPWSATGWSAAYLYADGRLISTQGGEESAPAWIEQRLTPKGVDYVLGLHFDARGYPQSLRALTAQSVPAGVWEDSSPRPYVPSRYAIVGWTDEATVGWTDQQGLERDSLLSLLRPRARHLLGGGDLIAGPGLELTTEDARTLAEILSDAGFEQTSRGDTVLGVVAYSRDVTFGIDIHRHPETLVIEFHPVLPDGRVPSL
jgi:hypothetical protein